MTNNAEEDETFANERDKRLGSDWSNPFRFARVDKPVQELKIQLWDHDRLSEPLFSTQQSSISKTSDIPVLFPMEEEKGHTRNSSFSASDRPSLLSTTGSLTKVAPGLIPKSPSKGLFVSRCDPFFFFSSACTFSYIFREAHPRCRGFYCGEHCRPAWPGGHPHQQIHVQRGGCQVSPGC